jgi:Fe-S-cluster containining protein
MSRFEVHYDCQRCTECCRWPGWVPVDETEIRAMARLLGMGEAEFIEAYTRLRLRRDGLALIEKPNGECVFLEGRDCRVQEAKPLQCRGFPNRWNFPGWRGVCEAVPRLRRERAPDEIRTSKEEGPEKRHETLPQQRREPHG